MDEAGNADRIAIIDHGKIVAMDTPDRLKDMVGGDVITIRTDDDAHAAEVLQHKYEVEPLASSQGLQFEIARGEEFIPELVRGFPIPVLSVNLRRPTLDDVFLKLTGREIREEQISSKEASRVFIRAHSRRGH